MYVVDTPDHYNGVIIIGQNFQGVTSESQNFNLLSRLYLFLWYTEHEYGFIKS